MTTTYDVIVIGGSYSGLAAGMALGRAMRRVLILDSGKPCNRQTPHSHNFLTQDGRTPGEIAALAREQVAKYDTVEFVRGLATKAMKTCAGFEIHTDSGDVFSAAKLIFATGIADTMAGIAGYAECWGISVLHCPYCHGYEVRNRKTGVLGNGAYGYEFSSLISNWTGDLTLYTNGPSTLTAEQTAKLRDHGIAIVENEVALLDHVDGHIRSIVFKDGSAAPVQALYARSPFVQHCPIPEALGCELTDQGYLKIDAAQRTTVPGVFAAGDNASALRTVANAVAMGTAAGMMVNKEFIVERF